MKNKTFGRKLLAATTETLEQGEVVFQASSLIVGASELASGIALRDKKLIVSGFKTAGASFAVMTIRNMGKMAETATKEKAESKDEAFESEDAYAEC